MAISGKRAKYLDALYAKRGSPKRLKTSEAYYYPDGARKIMLSNADGSLTAAGVHSL